MGGGRLADFNSPELKEPGGREGKAALVAVAMGRRVDCTARGKTWDRMSAVNLIAEVKSSVDIFG